MFLSPEACIQLSTCRQIAVSEHPTLKGVGFPFDFVWSFPFGSPLLGGIPLYKGLAWKSWRLRESVEFYKCCCTIQGSGFRAQGLGIRVSGQGFRALGSVFAGIRA